MKPKVFVASSAEHVDLAYALQEGLEHDAEVTVWSQGVFSPSRTTMAALIDQLDETDFAIFVFAPEDVTRMRDVDVRTVRDNVLLEFGLFAGRLGHERCYMVLPRGDDDLALPTDLLGLTPALFEPDRQDANMVAALGPACNRIRKSMKQLGPAVVQAAASPADTAPTTSLTSDENDCISLIQSWMGERPSSENGRAIRYSEVDNILQLVPGSARKYIQKAAARWSYIVEREGADTILFRHKEYRSLY